MRQSVVKRVRQPQGTYTGFLVARLNRSTEQLAGGCGFLASPSVDVVGTWARR